MPPSILAVLAEENRRIDGAVERYIYVRFNERQETVGETIAAIDAATPEKFHLSELLKLFITTPGIRRLKQK